MLTFIPCRRTWVIYWKGLGASFVFHPRPINDKFYRDVSSWMGREESQHEDGNTQIKAYHHWDFIPNWLVNSPGRWLISAVCFMNWVTWTNSYIANWARILQNESSSVCAWSMTGCRGLVAGRAWASWEFPPTKTCRKLVLGDEFLDQCFCVCFE